MAWKLFCAVGTVQAPVVLLGPAGAIQRHLLIIVKKWWSEKKQIWKSGIDGNWGDTWFQTVSTTLPVEACSSICTVNASKKSQKLVITTWTGLKGQMQSVNQSHFHKFSKLSVTRDMKYSIMIDKLPLGPIGIFSPRKKYCIYRESDALLCQLNAANKPKFGKVSGTPTLFSSRSE